MFTSYAHDSFWMHRSPLQSTSESLCECFKCSWISYSAKWNEKDTLHLCRINLADLVNINCSKYCPTPFVREITNLEESRFFQCDSQER